MYRRIQELKKKGYGKNKIKEDLKLDPATVRKYFHMQPEDYRKYLESRSSREKVFAECTDEIVHVYHENGNRRLNMSEN